MLFSTNSFVIFFVIFLPYSELFLDPIIAIEFLFNKLMFPMQYNFLGGLDISFNKLEYTLSVL